MPSACPVAPDGSKRSVPTGADDRGAVTMYTSDDNAETFKQVSRPLSLVMNGPLQSPLSYASMHLCLGSPVALMYHSRRGKELSEPLVIMAAALLRQQPWAVTHQT